MSQLEGVTHLVATVDTKLRNCNEIFHRANGSQCRSTVSGVHFVNKLIQL